MAPAARTPGEVGLAQPGAGERRAGQVRPGAGLTKDQSPPRDGQQVEGAPLEPAADQLAVGEDGLEERAAGERAVQEGGVGELREVEPAVAERAVGEDGAVAGGLGQVDAAEQDPRVLLAGEVLAVPVGLPDLGRGVTGSALLDAAGHPGGDDHRVVGRRERRGVGEVGAGELLRGHPGPDGGRQDVDPLAAARPADDLRAEQQPRAAVADQLDRDRLGARVVAGPRRPLDGLAAVVVPGLLRLGGAQPGPRDLQVADLRQRRPQDAGEAGRPGRRSPTRRPGPACWRACRARRAPPRR